MPKIRRPLDKGPSISRLRLRLHPLIACSQLSVAPNLIVVATAVLIVAFAGSASAQGDETPRPCPAGYHRTTIRVHGPKGAPIDDVPGPCVKDAPEPTATPAPSRAADQLDGMPLHFLPGAYDSQSNQLAQLGTVDLTAAENKCGSSLPFLADLNDLSKGRTFFEWAPVAGNTNYRWPTVDEPLFYASGTLKKFVPPENDIKFSHPFGRDFSMDVYLAPTSLYRLNLDAQTNLWLHVEIESGLFPYGGLWELGLPTAGDSIAVKGDWIVDCGHPGSPPHIATPSQPDNAYTSEIHPPTFLAFARAVSSVRTDSIAFVNPYRPTQLYYGKNNGAYSAKLQDYARFSDPATKPLADNIYDELHDYSPYVGIHQLIQATDPGALFWVVCPPKKPAGATGVGYAYRFAVRSRVALTVTRPDDKGCVTAGLAEGPDYVPAPLDGIRHDNGTWKWESDQRDAEGFLSLNAGGLVNTDVLQPICQSQLNVSSCTLRDLVTKKIHDGCPVTWDLCVPWKDKVKNDPFTDRYDPLSVAPQTSDLNLGEKTIIEHADAQPFPMYGRLSVWWQVGPSARLSMPGAGSAGRTSVALATSVDHRIFYDWWDLGQGGKGWQELGDQGRTDAAPEAALVGDYLFAVVKGNASVADVFLNQGKLGGPFVGWRSMGFQTKFAPGASASGKTSAVVAANPDGRTSYNWWNLGEAGRGWNDIGGQTNAAPAAALVTGNYLFVAVKGNAPVANIFLNQGTLGRPFVGWQSMGFQTKLAPAAASSGKTSVVVAVSPDGRIFYNWWNLGEGGRGWDELGGGTRTDAAPAAALVGNYLFVIVHGTDGNMYLNQGELGRPFVGWHTM